MTAPSGGTDISRPGREDASGTPEALLWALSPASDRGISVAGLMTATGMSRRWVYYRLRELADAGHAAQTEHGNWRATDTESDDP